MSDAVQTREGALILDSHKLAWHMDRVEAWEAGERIAPVSVDMALTRACGAMCSFCYAMMQESQARSSIKVKDALNLADDFATIGIRSVSLVSDGESTLSPAYVPFIQHLAQNGIDVANATNAWEWEPEKIEQVLPHLTWVRFTVATGRPFRYSVAGTGPDVETLRSLAAELGVSDSVRLLGWTEPDDHRALMKSADALIHPSPTPDPFPNAVLEGMAAGMVVFGSDVSGSALDRIDTGENGFIHRAGDVDDLAAQVAILLRDPGLASRMGPKAAARAAEWPLERGIQVIRALFQPS